MLRRRGVRCVALSLCVVLCCHGNVAVGASAATTANEVSIDTHDASAFFTLRSAVQQSGEVTVRSGDYACRLSFDSRPPQEEDREAKEEVRDETKDAEAVLNRLSRKTTCAESAKKGFWHYKVCPGRNVLQTHEKERYTLGKFSSVEGPKQLFTDGTPCGAMKPPRPRVATVQYVCGDRFVVAEATEVSTCSYHLVVTTPDACAVASMRRRVEDAAPDTAVDRPWTLGVEEGPNGHVACSAYVVDDLKVGGFSAGVDDLPLNKWRAFTVAVWRTDEVVEGQRAHSHATPLRVVEHVARNQNRQPLPSWATTVHQPDGVAVPVAVSSSEQFPPSPVEYLRVVVVDTEAEQE